MSAGRFGASSYHVSYIHLWRLELVVNRTDTSRAVCLSVMKPRPVAVLLPLGDMSRAFVPHVRINKSCCEK